MASKRLIRNIFKENELNPDSTVKEYLTVQQESNRQVKRMVLAYNFDLIITQNPKPRTHAIGIPTGEHRTQNTPKESFGQNLEPAS